jgi:cell division protease FtsH
MSDITTNNPTPDNNNNPMSGDNRNNPNFPRKKPKINITWLYIALFAIFIGMQFFSFGSKKTEVDYRTFMFEMLQPGDVEKIVVINKKEAEISIRQDKLIDPKYGKYFKPGEEPEEGPQFFMNIGSTDAFEKQLETAQQSIPEDRRIYPEYEERKDFFGEALGWILPFVLLFALWIFFFRRMTGGSGGNIFSVGKSRAQIFEKEKTMLKVD